jgi:hypothetical protein
MLRALLVAAAALVLTGCSNFACGGAANRGYAAGDCGLHTTFFASAAARAHPHALAKS